MAQVIITQAMKFGGGWGQQNAMNTELYARAEPLVGTANFQSLYWDNSTLKWLPTALLSIDHAAGFVGIGIATPLNPLNIYANTTAALALLQVEQDGTGDAALRWTLTGAGSYSAGIDNSDADKWKLTKGPNVSGGNEAITVDADINVGINTATPNTTHTVNGSQSIKRTDSGAGDYNPSILTTDYLITVDNSAAARAAIISNEDIAKGTTANPRKFVIKDEQGAAGTYAITVTLESGGLIDGLASFIISGNYDSITLYIDGTNGYLI